MKAHLGEAEEWARSVGDEDECIATAYRQVKERTRASQESKDNDARAHITRKGREESGGNRRKGERGW